MPLPVRYSTLNSVVRAFKAEFDQFGDKLTNKMIRSSLGRSLKPTLRYTRTLIRATKGVPKRVDGQPRPHLRDTLTKRVLRLRSNTGYYAVLGPRGRSDGKRGSDAPHAHLVDRGTVRRYRTRIGSKTRWAIISKSKWWLTLSESERREKLTTGAMNDESYMHYLVRGWEATEAEALNIFSTTLAQQVMQQEALPPEDD